MQKILNSGQSPSKRYKQETGGYAIAVSGGAIADDLE
jgi:hypothetical protein